MPLPERYCFRHRDREGPTRNEMEKLMTEIRETLVLKLAKVMAALAWSDGEMHGDEVNALKDVLADLPAMTGREWARLQMYLDSPVKAEEADALVADLLESINTAADRTHVKDALRRLAAADDQTNPEEMESLERICGAVDARQVGLGSMLGGLLRSLGARRKGSASVGGTREEHFDEYLRNPILFDMIREGIAASVDDADREKLAACAALMGRVAFQDEDLSDSEKQCIADVVSQRWSLMPDDARRLVESVARRTSRTTEYHSLMHGLVENMGKDERFELAKTLFAVANACDKTSHGEIEEIRRIAKSLRLSQKEFVAAKLTISREDRKGL